MSGNRTLWEEGRTPGRLVAYAASGAALVVVLLNLVGADQVGLFYDLSFVLISVAAALAIRPTEFFVAGVLPPLLMAGTMLALAIVDRSAVADPDDGLVQAVVSGLAHHATALVVGYGLALAVLALRQVAMKNSGRLRKPAPPARRSAAPNTQPRVARQRVPGGIPEQRAVRTEKTG
ncbi:MAG TPA: DUF6542 domain-containing protein [Nocardioidaceae bacterium]|nr:DUF6542 domain-containing protein [Nocardioidaceae bacterium]